MPVSSQACSTALCRLSAALLSATRIRHGAFAALTNDGRNIDRAVNVRPETRRRPEPAAR